MARLIKRVAAKRDLTDHFVFLAENASVNVARRQLQFTIHPSPFIMLPWTTERSSPSNPANEVESRALSRDAHHRLRRTVLPCLGYDAPGNPYPTLLGTNFPYDKFLPTKTDGDRAYVYCDAAKNQGITASSYGASASGDRNAFCRNC